MLQNGPWRRSDCRFSQAIAFAFSHAADLSTVHAAHSVQCPALESWSWASAFCAQESHRCNSVLTVARDASATMAFLSLLGIWGRTGHNDRCGECGGEATQASHQQWHHDISRLLTLLGCWGWWSPPSGIGVASRGEPPNPRAAWPVTKS